MYKAQYALRLRVSLVAYHEDPEECMCIKFCAAQTKQDLLAKSGKANDD